MARTAWGRKKRKKRRRCGPVGKVMLLLSSRTDCSPARISVGPQISLKVFVSEVTYAPYIQDRQKPRAQPRSSSKKKSRIRGRQFWEMVEVSTHATLLETVAVIAKNPSNMGHTRHVSRTRVSFHTPRGCGRTC